MRDFTNFHIFRGKQFKKLKGKCPFRGKFHSFVKTAIDSGDFFQILSQNHKYELSPVPSTVFSVKRLSLTTSLSILANQIISHNFENSKVLYH